MNKNQPTTYMSSDDTLSCQKMNSEQFQNFVLVWLEKDLDVNNKKQWNTIAQKQNVSNVVNTFSNTDQCIDFITDMDDTKVLMIISGALGKTTVPLIHQIPQIYSIFILCQNKKRHEQWVKNWSKIMGIFTELNEICEILKQAENECEQDSMTFNFLPTTIDINKKNLVRFDPTFMYCEIIKNILLSKRFDKHRLQEFIDYCRHIFADNEKQLCKIEEFQKIYHQKSPVWWYTCETFLYPMVNRALRLSNLDLIIKLGFFINDLHHYMDELHKKQSKEHETNKLFRLYRGQGMSLDDFNQMKETEGGLMSFTNFLSTNEDENISLKFARRSLSNPNSIGVLFIITIDPSKSTAPFVSINNISAVPRENEVLFSMNTIFRIKTITPMRENSRLFRVDLTLTGSSDPDLSKLIEFIRQEKIPKSSEWYRLSSILSSMEQFQQVQKICEVLTSETGENQSASNYHQLESVKLDRRKHKQEIASYEEVIKIQEQVLPSTHPDLAVSYNRIGNVYSKLGDYSKAISFHEKALEIRKKSLPDAHPDLAVSYNSIGNVYLNMGDYQKSLASHEKALDIRKHLLCPTHPDLAMSHSYIANVYSKMRKYSEAISSHEKALEIRKQSLPAIHLDLALSYDNIGNVYMNMDNYSKSLESHEKALEIRKQLLSSTHPDLGMSYNNIGKVYSKMKKWAEAILSHQKALEIRKKLLPSSQFDLAMSYNNLAHVYSNMKAHPLALCNYEKALEIRKQILPITHPDLGMSHNNIGKVYSSMSEWPKALLSHKKALEIRKQALLPTHPDLALSYNNIGNVYFKMGEYSKALSNYNSALEIRKKILPITHSDVKMLYENIAKVYSKLD